MKRLVYMMMALVVLFAVNSWFSRFCIYFSLESGCSLTGVCTRDVGHC